MWNMAMRYAAIVLLFVACAVSRPPENRCVGGACESSQEQHDRLVLVGTNDFHGYLRPLESELHGQKVVQGGAEWFAGYVRVLEKRFGDRLILLDGGDMFQGTMESNLFQGEPVTDFYNLLPYRAVAVGNHEFDYGVRKKGDPDRLGALKARMAQSNFPFVQANIFHKGSNELWREKNLFPSVLVMAGGYKVGILGLTTTSTPAKTLPANVAQLEFRDLVEPTLHEAQRLRNQGAEIVLIATHEGGEKPGEPIHDLLAHLPKGTVDAVVSGHSHSEIHEFVAGVPVIQSKTRGLNFGRIDLFVDKKTRKLEPSLTVVHDMHWICGTWFQKEERCDPKSARDRITAGKTQTEDFFPLRKPVYEGVEVQPDLEVRKALAPFFTRADERRKERLGNAQVDFDWYASGESQMGFLFLHAFHARFPRAKVVYLNGGGIRRRFFKGVLTYGDLYEVHPFDNFAVEVRMTGRQLKELLRVGVSGSQTIPAVLGVCVKYFRSESPAFDRDLNHDGKKEKWERDRLVPGEGVVWEATGKPVGDNEVFWLATNDYLSAGGDNTAHVFDEIPASQRRYAEIVQRDVVAEYLRKKPGLKLPSADEMRVEAVQ